MRLKTILILGLFVWALCGPASQAAQAQPCDDLNECTGQGFCGPDNFCENGPPLPDGTRCTSALAGDCLLNPTCVDGECVGGTPRPSGSPCRLLSSPCFTQGTCFSVPPIPGLPPIPPMCMGSVPIDCPDDGNPLTEEFCNPETGRCESVNLCVSDPCMERRVVGRTCVETPRNNGAPCDDFNECTANTRCQNGECVEGAGPVPTPTPTRAGPTPAPTPTPTPVTGRPCTGDCGGDRTVTVDEIISMVNIVLGVQPLGVCPAADGNGDGTVAIDDVIAAVNNALSGCG